MRQNLPLNFDWQFRPAFDHDDLKSYNQHDYELVHVPHQVSQYAINYFDEKKAFKEVCYRKAFVLDDSFMHRRIILRFEGIAHQATVYINGQHCTTHKGGYTSFDVDISEHVLFGSTNWVVVVADGSEDSSIPPFGNVVDYLGYSGIYREVTMIITEKDYIADVFITTDKELEKIKTVKFVLDIHCQKTGSYYVDIKIVAKDQEVMAFTSRNIVGGTNHLECESSQFQLWDIDQPILYRAIIKLYRNDIEIDEIVETFGVRTFSFTTKGFFLNGKQRVLIGLNRHQSYAYCGYAMPASMQRRDAEILKNECHINIVRTSHYPQSKHFFNACDELGLLVFTEVPGWQFIGNQSWQDNACLAIEKMIIQNRNHPSIVTWGVRINESSDHHAFYTRTNQIARKLDPSRPTTGVRNFSKSEALEDIYSYNDFVHSGKNQGCDNPDKICPNTSIPYIISEHNGHMFSTKSFDPSDRRSEQALRHARVIGDSLQYPRINAVIGWCAFDYQTHQEFGSGDKICYHGVYDIYRTPKIAANVYKTQTKEPFISVDSSMNIGDYPSSNMKQVVVFTNCEKVRFYKNDQLLGEYTVQFVRGFAKPLIIYDFVGNQIVENENYSRKKAALIKDVLLSYNRYGTDMPFIDKIKMIKLMSLHQFKFETGAHLYTKYIGNWGSKSVIYRFEGVIDNKPVCEIIRRPIQSKHLEVSISHDQLIEKNTIDVSQITVMILDQDGQRLSYYIGAISIETEGGIEHIGPSTIPFTGGVASFYVRTLNLNKDGKITIHTDGFNQYVIPVKVKKE